MRSGFCVAFCHAVTQGQQGWPSYGSRTTHIRVGKKTQILHEFACTPSSTQDLVWLQERRCVSAWVDALLVPTNMRAFRVGLLGGMSVLRDARCGRSWCVRARLFLPGPLRSTAYVCESPRVRIHISSQDRRVYAAVAPSQWMARVLLAVRTSSRMQEIK